VRDAALLALSRDHHDVLVEALRLRRAAGGDPAALKGAAAAFLDFFREEIAGHLGDEEEVVLPACPTLVEGAERIRREHVEIRDLAERIAGALGDPAALSPLAAEMGALLDDHVRYEERAYFMDVQAALPPAALEDLGVRLEAFRSARGRVEACRRPRAWPQGTS